MGGGASKADPTLAELQKGYELKKKGDFAGSARAFDSCAKQRSKKYGLEHSLTLAARQALSGCMISQKKYGEAQSILNDVIEKRKKVLGDNHADTLTSVSTLATLYHQMKQLNKAEPLYKEVLTGRQALPDIGPSHPSTLSSMANLGMCLSDLEKFGEAEKLFTEVLNQQTSKHGSESKETIEATAQLALCHFKSGKSSASMPLYKQVLAKCKRNPSLGTECALALSAENQLGNIFQKQKIFDQAEQYHRQCFEGRGHVLGVDHPDTLSSMNNLALALKSLNRTGEAETLYMSCLEKKRLKLGKTHTDTLGSANNLASLYRDQGKYDMAEMLFKECIDPVVEEASRLSKAGQNEKAKSLFEQALAMGRPVLGKAHPSIVEWERQLSSVC